MVCRNTLVRLGLRPGASLPEPPLVNLARAASFQVCMLLEGI